ncbi:complex I subunit 5 family protein [Rhizomonospora bruguierae]|uniref:complex I subunit 5 family protein n=1 Tax=Rhizomonospora bruguierae TaxID=1581705 RepID=UPI0020BECA84|nr:complex I subunit 5 family protein [Micromonospora sp. NBRC 107566]
MSRSALAPLAVVAPILAACVVLVAGRRAPRLVIDVLATATAAGVAATTGFLAASTLGGRAVTWSGGWSPVGGRSVGVVLVADPLGAGLACLAGLLTAVAMLYSWRYLASLQAHYHTLVLLFLAGLVGFALTGDLFNMFVFFELMGAAAYALTALRIEEPDSVQGGLTFAVINSLGAYLSLMGVGLIYARTGELGLARIGRALGGQRADALVIVAFVLVVTGFLVKAAVAPMHFWLADAHAVAPAPICVLMSGVMVELGVYAVARVYTTAFAGVLPGGVLRTALLVPGLLTVTVGSGMCLIQRHIKRLLAYSTIAHTGLFVVAFAVLTPGSVAGAALYVLGHAGIKGALFLVTGLLLDRFGSVDERDLFGRGSRRDPGGWFFLAGGVALAGAPPLGPGIGKAVAEDAAGRAGYPWLVAAFVVGSAVTGGAVLRAGLRVFLGLGHPPQPPASETQGSGEQPETPSLVRAVPRTMLAAIVLLLLAGALPGVVPPLWVAAGRAARMFLDRTGYAGQTLDAAPPTPVAPLPGLGWTTTGVVLGLVSVTLAVAVALLGVYRPRRAGWRGPVRSPAPVELLHRLHSGHVGDYVAWLFLGVAVVGALIAVPLLAGR